MQLYITLGPIKDLATGASTMRMYKFVLLINQAMYAFFNVTLSITTLVHCEIVPQTFAISLSHMQCVASFRVLKRRSLEKGARFD